MKPYNADDSFVSVSYHPENECLNITWNGFVDAGKLRSGYMKALEILENDKVQRCLIDTSQRILQEDGTLPVIEDIFSQALSIIKEPLFVAQVLTPEAFFTMTDHFHYDYLHMDDNHYIIIKHFLKREEAEEWLNLVTKRLYNS